MPTTREPKRAAERGGEVSPGKLLRVPAKKDGRQMSGGGKEPRRKLRFYIVTRDQISVGGMAVPLILGPLDSQKEAAEECRNYEGAEIAAGYVYFP